MRTRFLVVLLALAFVAMLLAACSGLRVDGECTYTRTVTVAYQCAPGGHAEHYRVAPMDQP